MAEERISVQLAIERVYLKDLSFESPGAPTVFTKQWKPQIQVDINTVTNRVDENRFEVVLTVTIEAKLDEESAAIVEMQQAGIFRVEGPSGPALDHVLAVTCPNILFPYIRETVDSMMVRGTLPPFNLSPVNFEALYANALAKKNADQDQPLN